MPTPIPRMVNKVLDVLALNILVDNLSKSINFIIYPEYLIKINNSNSLEIFSAVFIFKPMPFSLTGRLKIVLIVFLESSF